MSDPVTIAAITLAAFMTGLSWGINLGRSIQKWVDRP